MRYMWICHPRLAANYVEKCLVDNGAATVIRELTFAKRACWVFLTSRVDYYWACDQQLNQYASDYWSISSCNKQYVTNAVTGKYIGALGEVDIQEANRWVHADYDGETNWYLTDVETDKIWMPLHRNPNKIIPTGDAGYCRHCGNTSAQTPGNRYNPVYRPWPLHVDA